MSDLPFDPTDGTECPVCGVEGEPIGLLAPATGVRCRNPDCPIRDYWSSQPAGEFEGADDA